MKKFMIVTLILTLLVSVPVFAEEATVKAVKMDWNQEIINAFAADGFDGNMGTVTLQDGKQFRILIPDGFSKRDLTQADQSENVVLALVNESTNSTIKIRDHKMDGVSSIAELAQSIIKANPKTAGSFAVINGTNAVITTTEAEASVTVSFDLGGSRFVQIDFTPLKDNNKLAQYFMAAIQFGK